MVCVFAANKVPYYKEGQFLSTAKKLVDESVKEEGCITYELCVKDDSYIFFERWERRKLLKNIKKLRIILNVCLKWKHCVQAAKQ